VEGQDPRVLLAVGVAPRDALVRQLLRDLGVSLVAAGAEPGDPMQVGLIGRAHLLDALHELRELLELRPRLWAVLTGTTTSIDGSMVAMRASLARDEQRASPAPGCVIRLGRGPDTSRARAR
jgi:hypothetical protein